jgi:hypothetical protein
MCLPADTLPDPWLRGAELSTATVQSKVRKTCKPWVCRRLTSQAYATAGAVAGARTMHGSLCIAPPQGQCMRCPSPGAVQSMSCGCQRRQSKGTNTGFADAEGCTSAPPFASESDGHAGARTEAGGRRPGGWRRGRGSRERTPHWPRPRGDARVPLHCPTPGAVHALPHPRGNTKARAVGNRRE